jgi:hypothetical protein
VRAGDVPDDAFLLPRDRRCLAQVTARALFNSAVHPARGGAVVGSLGTLSVGMVDAVTCSWPVTGVTVDALQGSRASEDYRGP